MKDNYSKFELVLFGLVIGTFALIGVAVGTGFGT